MTYVEWPYTVNTKFFKGTGKPEENTTTTEYASGRKVSILKNTRFVFEFKCSLGVTNVERNAFVLRQSRMKAKDRKTGF